MLLMISIKILRGEYFLTFMKNYEIGIGVSAFAPYLNDKHLKLKLENRFFRKSTLKLRKTLAII